MPWVRLDDLFSEHPKTLKLSPFAVTLYLRALCWSSRYLTDGEIPEEIIPRLTVGLFDPTCNATSNANVTPLVTVPVTPEMIIKELLIGGQWEKTEGKSYLIHDFLTYQPSRKKVLKGRLKTARRVEEYRLRRKVGNAPGNAVTEVSGNAVSNAHVTPFPSPSPSPLKVTSKEVTMSLSKAVKKFRWDWILFDLKEVGEGFRYGGVSHPAYIIPLFR